MPHERRADPSVRVGVVGLGWFGRTHVDAWSSVRGAEVVGICDRDPQALAPAEAAPQADFHADAGVSGQPPLDDRITRFDSLDSLLASGIDVLDVVVTEDEHATCVRAGLLAGVHVVVEKPLATTLQEAVDLVHLAEARGVQLHAGQVLRFDPRYAVLAESVRGTTLRRLAFSRHFQTSAHDVYGRAHPVLNAAVHDIDIAVWLVGRAPDRVTAFGSHFLGRTHPDSVDLVLEWDGGLRAVVQNSWHLAASCPSGFVFETVVHAAEGTWTVRNEPLLQEWTASAATAPELMLWPRWADARQGALVAQLQHVTDRVTGRVSTERVPLTDVLQVMSTCRAAVDALATGVPQQPVALDRLVPTPTGRSDD